MLFVFQDSTILEGKKVYNQRSSLLSGSNVSRAMTIDDLKFLVGQN
jgi:hypothetical protein